MIWDSTVSTVTKLWLVDLGFESFQGQEVSFYFKALGPTKPPILYVLTGSFSVRGGRGYTMAVV